MLVHNFDSNRLLNFDPLVSDYIHRSPKVQSFITHFPDEISFQKCFGNKTFSIESRKTLCQALNEQYSIVPKHDAVSKNLIALQEQNTFTVTTGHQLCLLTGPLYFIYKIASTVKLAQKLSAQNPNHTVIPVYWMASEDHDFEEVNHVYLFGKKIEWKNDWKGAVGSLSTKSLKDFLIECKDVFGLSANAEQIFDLFNRAYAQPTLAQATFYLVNELFGEYGLIVIEPNVHALKKMFVSILSDELLNSTSSLTIGTTNGQLKSLGYTTQINSRPINIFYLQDNSRLRIEKLKDDQWSLIDGSKNWDKKLLEEELAQFPERFSPNVALRPVYQEVILPNLAYIGGPGELAYWLQLKSTFDAFKVVFPLIILRDNALVLNEKNTSRLSKLGLSLDQLFQPLHALQRKLLEVGETSSLEKEKNEIQAVFYSIADKMKAIDATLEASAKGELQKLLMTIEHFEKKMIKALKSKEEVKMQQLDKLLSDVFPDGVFQERHDNFFQYQTNFNSNFIPMLIDAFDPLANQLHIFVQE